MGRWGLKKPWSHRSGERRTRRRRAGQSAPQDRRARCLGADPVVSLLPGHRRSRAFREPEVADVSGNRWPPMPQAICCEHSNLPGSAARRKNTVFRGGETGERPDRTGRRGPPQGRGASAGGFATPADRRGQEAAAEMGEVAGPARLPRGRWRFPTRCNPAAISKAR